MGLKENFKKAARILGIGAIWVYVLSIPYEGRLLFDHAYDHLVDNKLVQAVAREAQTAIKDAKTKAREALEESEAEVAKANNGIEQRTEF